MHNRREFMRYAAMLTGSLGLAGTSQGLPEAIRRALAIEPAPGTTFEDAEHIVILMQENRSFDHCFGTLRGVRGFADPRAMTLADGHPVWAQSDRKGQRFGPFRLDIKGTKITWMGSLPHGWTDQVDAAHGGRHDGWLEAKRSGEGAYAAMPLTMGYYPREDLPFVFAGSASLAAGGLAMIETIFAEGLIENAARMGRYFTEAAWALGDPWIGDVRFTGLLGGIELVRNRDTKEVLAKADVAKIKDHLHAQGMLITLSGWHGNVLRLQPPLSITAQQIDQFISALRTTLRTVRGG